MFEFNFEILYTFDCLHDKTLMLITLVCVDVHLDCEAKIANFLGTPDSILYSYGLSTMFSAIPAFCKKGDIVIA